MKTRTVTGFLNCELKEYAMDILENRCIPSIIDSFKPSQRKVVYIAEKIWKTGNEKPMKVFQLTGRTAMEAYYHHGNKSMDDLITNMGQKFKNNLQKGNFEHPNSKLTLEQVLYIKNNCIVGSKLYGIQTLAKKFNVCNTTIKQIIQGKSYRYVNKSDNIGKI